MSEEMSIGRSAMEFSGGLIQEKSKIYSQRHWIHAALQGFIFIERSRA
jgi:hypothetical protein